MSVVQSFGFLFVGHSYSLGLVGHTIKIVCTPAVTDNVINKYAYLNKYFICFYVTVNVCM